jgi:hypothetical protein
MIARIGLGQYSGMTLRGEEHVDVLKKNWQAVRWHLGGRRGAAVRAGDSRGGHDGRHASQRIQGVIPEL